MTQAKILRLILSDQLKEGLLWFQKKHDNVTYLLMEVRQETDYVKHHIQKVASFFAAMHSFSHRLIDLGHRVIYLCLNDPSNAQDFEYNLKSSCAKKNSPVLITCCRMRFAWMKNLKQIPVNWGFLTG